MVHGIGINDVVGAWKTPIYGVWRRMVQRCYDPKTMARHPTYKGCTVCNSWHLLSTFWRWAEPRWAPGLHLDKDICKPGNKVYSPSTCAFVTPALNLLLTDCRAVRGRWPIGVALHNSGFQARCVVDGKLKYLGHFDTPEEAHAAYVKFKTKLIRQTASKQTDPKIAAGLRRHAKLLGTK